MAETAACRGQDYVSIFICADLVAHGGDPDKVTDTSSDMSTAFISGIGAHLPNARMTFDRYHLAAKLSGAIDTVRRDEIKTRPSSSAPAGCG
ncbi:MAG: transposase [Pseudonocardiaceae bacterium]